MFEVVIVEATVYFAQEFGRWLQVDLGGTDIDVAHVRCQRGEPGVHILAVPIPGQESVDCEGVAQIMDARANVADPRNAALV